MSKPESVEELEWVGFTTAILKMSARITRLEILLNAEGVETDDQARALYNARQHEWREKWRKTG